MFGEVFWVIWGKRLVTVCREHHGIVHLDTTVVCILRLRAGTLGTVSRGGGAAGSDGAE